MLCLSRLPNQAILIGNDISVIVLKVVGQNVRLGIIAPPDIAVDREEVRAIPDYRMAGIDNATTDALVKRDQNMCRCQRVTDEIPLASLSPEMRQQ